MKYKINDLTPESLRCLIGACPAIYQVIDRTPEPMRCLIGACPAIYQTTERTPKPMECLGGIGCNSIHEYEGDYLLVGEKVNAVDYGLENKVGENECLIKVSKRLIDEMER